MTKLLEFPPPKKRTVTWLEAMESMINNADEETKNKSVKNLLIVSEDINDYSFGLLKQSRVREMLGTIECVKAYFIMALHHDSEYDYPE